MFRKLSNVLLNDGEGLDFDKLQTIIEKGVVEDTDWNCDSRALVVRVNSAHGIRDVQTFGRQEPYVVATMLPSYEKRRTLAAVLGGTNPEWGAEEVNRLVLKVEESTDSDTESDSDSDGKELTLNTSSNSTTEKKTLLLELWNENSLQEDDFIGSTSVSNVFILCFHKN